MPILGILLVGCLKLEYARLEVAAVGLVVETSPLSEVSCSATSCSSGIDFGRSFPDGTRGKGSFAALMEGVVDGNELSPGLENIVAGCCGSTEVLRSLLGAFADTRGLGTPGIPRTGVLEGITARLPCPEGVETSEASTRLAGLSVGRIVIIGRRWLLTPDELEPWAAINWAPF